MRLMGSRLLNVRLGPEDERLVQQLRARGVSISAVVRRALRVEAANTAGAPVDTEQLLDDILAEHPTPATSRRKRPTTTDRRAVREHIRRRLRAKK